MTKLFKSCNKQLKKEQILGFCKKYRQYCILNLKMLADTLFFGQEKTYVILYLNKKIKNGP